MQDVPQKALKALRSTAAHPRSMTLDPREPLQLSAWTGHTLTTPLFAEPCLVLSSTPLQGRELVGSLTILRRRVHDESLRRTDIFEAKTPVSIRAGHQTCGLDTYSIMRAYRKGHVVEKEHQHAAFDALRCILKRRAQPGRCSVRRVVRGSLRMCV